MNCFLPLVHRESSILPSLAEPKQNEKINKIRQKEISFITVAQHLLIKLLMEIVPSPGRVRLATVFRARGSIYQVTQQIQIHAIWGYQNHLILFRYQIRSAMFSGEGKLFAR
jgi:hypothetical protein